MGWPKCRIRAEIQASHVRFNRSTCQKCQRERFQWLWWTSFGVSENSSREIWWYKSTDIIWIVLGTFLPAWSLLSAASCGSSRAPLWPGRHAHSPHRLHFSSCPHARATIGRRWSTRRSAERIHTRHLWLLFVLCCGSAQQTCLANFHPRPWARKDVWRSPRTSTTILFPHPRARAFIFDRGTLAHCWSTRRSAESEHAMLSI